jgi:ZIP family zinc transporter
MKILTIVLLAVGCSTAVGVIGGLLFNGRSHRWNDIVLGFSAGVMLAAACAGLLAEAFSAGGYSTVLAVTGAFAGAGVISVLDRIVPHLHKLAGIDIEEHRSNGAISRTLLFIAALAIHKIPEGLAVGVSFGTGDVGDVLTVAGAISIQNIPEAFVIVAPLSAIGVSRPRIIAVSAVIAAVSIVSVVCGTMLVYAFASALPFLLAAAGGAMFYVISDEIIPETHAHGFEKSATFALISGFLLVLALKNIIG